MLWYLRLQFAVSQQLRIRGRSWNRGNVHGSSNGDSQMNMSAKNDDWDQEYTPKSKKYFLVSCDLLLYLSIYEKTVPPTNIYVIELHQEDS